jgi:hypothetical protein
MTVAAGLNPDVLAFSGPVLLFLSIQIHQHTYDRYDKIWIIQYIASLSEPTLYKRNNILIILVKIRMMRRIGIVWQDRTTLIVSVVTVALQRACIWFASSWIQTWVYLSDYSKYYHTKKGSIVPIEQLTPAPTVQFPTFQD